MYSQKEMDSFKIKGTQHDRSIKFTPEQRSEIIFLYENRKKYNLTCNKIAEIYNTTRKQVYRITHPENYASELENQRINGKSHSSTAEDNIRRRAYKTQLLDELLKKIS